jgi:hypothetical protein
LAETRELAWLDASLGCPKLSVLNIQVVTDGYRILLDANRTSYENHTDTGEQAILCENPEYPIMPFKLGKINGGQPWMPN